MNEKRNETEKNKAGGGGQAVTWAGLFIVLILFMSVANIKLLFEPVKRFNDEEIDFSGFAEEVRDAYVKDFTGKYNFINVNGLYYRATGRRILNGVMRLNNGMLTEASMPERDIEPLANNIIAFSEFLTEENIPFLYVQAPFKIDEEGLLLPAGREEQFNISVDNLLARLLEENINTLDLRPYISATPEMLEKYFNKTDHHWNYTGAFVAFQHITEVMQKILPDTKLDLAYTDIGQWNSHLLKDWFLGSRGRRVGQFFAGVDDIVYYTPKFETNMSCAVPNRALFNKGDFSVANISNKYLEKIDYFGNNAYCLYIGGDYPLVQHRNAKAPNDMKVLMIKDSFTLPVQAYMSTLFKEVDVIDPRYFSECSVSEYVDNNQPDMVIMMINPSQFTSKAYQNFGSDKVNINSDSANTMILYNPKIELAARNSNYNCIILTSELEYNKTYVMKFDNIEFTQGESNGVTVFLYDTVNQEPVAAKVFDIEYCQDNGGFEWVFNTPSSEENELQLLLYSGLWKATSGIGSIYTNVTLNRLD